MTKNLTLIITIIVLLLGMTSCAKSQPKDETVNITTSFYPLFIFTLNITQDVPGVLVTNLTKPSTGCLHDYSLVPADMKVLEATDIFIANGGGMEGFLDKVNASIPPEQIIDSSTGIEPIVQNGEVNPHFFVSISDAIQQVRNISSGLEKLDPTHAALYKKNAKAYITRLTTLKDTAHAELAAVKGKEIITFHEAFPYFAREFGLNISAVIEREPGSEPSAGELAQTVDLINEKKIKAIFVEPQYSAKAAQTIVLETEASIYTLDPAVTGDLKPDAYERIMEQNVKTLKEALL